jgi:heme/copper-type cytochrome/quinol oxidase subunit 1
MEKRFIKSINSPAFAYWIGISFIVILSFIKREELKVSAIDINIHDTYFVAARDQITIMYCFFLAVLALIYFICQRLKLPMNQKLSWIHSLTSILGMTYILFPFALFSNSEANRFSAEITDLNTYIVIMLLLVFFCQILLPINIVCAILKKRTG